MTPERAPDPAPDPEHTAGPYESEDLTTVRVDQFLPHTPGKVWRALTEPELIAQWLMPCDFRLEVGHRYTMTTAPRPNTGFSGTTAAEVLAFEPGRMLAVRWQDASGTNRADWTITWTLAPEGRGTRLFLVHEGFDPDDDLQMMARKIMGSGWRTHIMDALDRVVGQL
ncbi:MULTISPECIES: SRPBCC domain-containing protein [unclassified Streptomyces]|uniref:SRPBCC family protein n=1 Tax=unclassified Streptomyces TaxID=2593676 RepID=UPI002E34D4C8|nr:SRPBCC domain-containing protein [Streptomyces sp. NBC_01278]